MGGGGKAGLLWLIYRIKCSRQLSRTFRFVTTFKTGVLQITILLAVCMYTQPKTLTLVALQELSRRTLAHKSLTELRWVDQP